jgi:hypothetical protein
MKLAGGTLLRGVLFLAISGGVAAQTEPPKEPPKAPVSEAPSDAPSRPMPSVRRGELGVRYWVSTGETKFAHNAQGLNPEFGNPTSVLLYENLDVGALELFGRQNFRNNLFLKGLVGGGRVHNGSFNDLDFDFGQVLDSDTTSSVPEGRIGYGTIDLGYQWVLGDGISSLGVFAGFSQWTEDVDAYGLVDNLGGGEISRSVRVISNKVRWRALRVGVSGDFVLGRARLGLDLAAVPYAKFRNEDSHHLRAQPVGSNPLALGPVPNIVSEGDGWGVQWDAELRYEILRRTELGIGLRYWYLDARDADVTFAGLLQAPIVEFYSMRTGVTLSLRRTW